jgi:hypothetical protein
MVDFPRIQIFQQFAKIAFKAEHGRLELEQPKAKMDFHTTMPKVEIHQPLGELKIDQSRAWAALGLGGHLQTMLKIYDGAREIGLEAIGNIAQRGDRLAAIHTGENAIAEIAKDVSRDFRHLNVLGPASYDNVDIEYTVRSPEFHPIPGKADTQITKSEPYIRYTKGKFLLSMTQYAKVTIIPPPIRIDVRY